MCRPRSRWRPGLLLGVFLALPAAAQENQDCIDCHGVEGLVVERDGRQVTLSVDPDRYASSVHGMLDCIACHWQLDGVESYPHEGNLERVTCTDCHDDDDGPVERYRNSIHGRLAEQGDPRAPACQDCHGSHYLRPLREPDSSISPFNVPAMCVQCHVEGGDLARAFDLSGEEVSQRYRERIHGPGLHGKGLTVTAVCTSCHTGHDVLPHDDPASTIHRDKVDATCKTCHGRIEDVHRDVVTRELWDEPGAVPLCVGCHQPHEERGVSYEADVSDADCLRCHAGAVVASDDGRSLSVSPEEHSGSVHGRNGVACAQCHAGVAPGLERSCSSITEAVDCGVCHAARVAEYEGGIHGQLRAAGDDNAPSCTDCHGVHGILEHAPPAGASEFLVAAIRRSPTYVRNVPDLCGRCHRDGAQAARRYEGPADHIVERYSMSIHGQGLLESGLTVTAVCSDCHTAHGELPAADPASSVHAGNITATCGRCHEGILEEFATSIHSREGNPGYDPGQGMPQLPNCSDCHTSHTVARTDRPDFQLGIMDQCGNCHGEIVATYFETYHGKASELGDTTKAKCQDCHGAHSILPPHDPRSLLSQDHIVGTCGKCHEGAHPQFTTYLTHATHKDPERYPALYWAYVGMTALLVGTFAFFGLHTLAWLPRSWRLRKRHSAELAAAAPRTRHFQRFTPYQRALHLIVILSFFGLAITGMMLKFSYAGWAHALSRMVGGAVIAGWIHRVCAVATFAYVVLHLIDVARSYRRSDKSARDFLFGPDSLLPRFSDVREFFGTVKWFLGRGPVPKYGRWTYWEKFDYFAVFWGVVVIGSTGLCLWFPELVTRVLPGWAINVATIIHSDEALLATGFIFTIHFFNTHFRPEKFPMDPVIFTGRMKVEELRVERPALYEELVASGELEQHLVEPATPAFVRVARSFGWLALVVGLTLVALIVYALFFGP